MSAVAEIGTPPPAAEAPAVTQEAASVEPVVEVAEETTEERFEKALRGIGGEKPAEKTEEPTKIEEKKVEEAKKEEPLPDIAEISKSFAALKHKTKRFDDDRAAFNAEKTEFEAKKTADSADFEKQRSEFNAHVEMAKKNPLSALKALGWSPEQLYAYIEKDGQVPPERLIESAKAELKKELEDLRAERAKETEEKKARDAEALKAEQRTQADGFARRVGLEIADVADAEVAKYPYTRNVILKNPGLVHRAVLNSIASHMAKEKKVLAVSDAMMQFEEQAKANAEMLGLPPISSDPRQAGAVQPANPGNIEPISKSDAAKSGLVPKRAPDEMSDDERYELGLRLARGEAT